MLVTGPVHADLVVPESEQQANSSDITRIVNHGTIAGTPQHRFVFDAYTIVTGGGRFDHVDHWGVFAPGNSPGVTTGENQAIFGTLQIELGGTDGPGFGPTNHDQVNDDGTLALGASSVLNVLSFNGFVPAVGDSFTILTWTDGLVGSFGSVVLDSQFTVNGITFEQIITNPSGAGNLTLVAVPEPSAFLFLGLVTGLVVFSISIVKKVRNFHASE